ncbi:MAG: TIR domain-containing protein [Candidatus Accumulibacter sp.]|nr:TIR domain-containing protein [Accumulibacter sp.]
MNFADDVFISYAHLDNQAFVEGQAGWISRFDRALKIRLGQLLGREPRIWRDPKLQGNDYFADTLVERLPGVAALVAVLSPRYANSDWCRREMSTFLEVADAGSGSRIGNKSRLFKVIKTPLPLERHPPEVESLLGYEFFCVDSETGRAQELDQTYGQEMQARYWQKLDDLAYDLADLLQVLADHGTQAPLAGVSKGNVYLAETSSDLQPQREAIRRDLLHQGYRVLPDRAPPSWLASDWDAFVQQQLAACQLSIHLIGSEYGIVPEGTQSSIVALQYELAARRSMSDLARLIWLPPELVVNDERQQRFVEQLHTDARLHQRGDLLQTPFEDLKTAIYRMLNPPAGAAHGRATPAAEGVVRIYLICDERDRDQIAALEDHLFAEGFEVILPLFDPDETPARLDHEENLQSCDALLIYYGEGNELWQRRKLSEVRKSAGLGRSAPLRGKAIYVAPPLTAQKVRLRTHEALVLQQLTDTFDPGVLATFIASLRETDTGSRSDVKFGAL